MIPHVASRGHSFVGAGLYYLHDKGADTSERVLFTQTRNLTTDDAEKAMRYMAYTAMHAEEKKREAGISVAGAKQSKGAVYAFSLSWHPDEGVTHGEMVQAADACLQRLGLSEHEAVLVGHGDTEHPHVHVVVNLVHPESGKIASIRQDQRILSAWALEYEQARGEVRCAEREKNAERRKAGELTKYQDERVNDAPDIAALYRACDTGKAFAAALEGVRYTLAQGDKGRVVIVDGAGNIQNLARQLDGVKKKDLTARLADVLEGLPEANSVAGQRREQGREIADHSAPDNALPLPAPVASLEVAHVVHVARLTPEPKEGDSNTSPLRHLGEYTAPRKEVAPYHVHMAIVARHGDRTARGYERMAYPPEWGRICGKAVAYLTAQEANAAKRAERVAQQRSITPPLAKQPSITAPVVPEQENILRRAVRYIRESVATFSRQPIAWLEDLRHLRLRILEPDDHEPHHEKEIER